MHVAKKTDSPESEPIEESSDSPQGKGHPTPTRKERELANRRPLVPDDRRLARQQSREQIRAQREKARIGLMAGDEKFLPQRDKGEQRRFVRDYVDARFSIGELMIPVMVIVLAASFSPQSWNLYIIAILGLWIYFAILIVDSVVLGILINRKVTAKFGSAKERGLRWYAIMRGLQLRRMRVPKPNVSRGDYPA